MGIESTKMSAINHVSYAKLQFIKNFDIPIL